MLPVRLNYMSKEKIIPLPEKIVTEASELMVLADLARNETYMTLLRRVARKYAEILRNQSYVTAPEHPHLAILHTRYFERIKGIEIFLGLIEKAPKELEKLDKNSP